VNFEASDVPHVVQVFEECLAGRLNNGVRINLQDPGIRVDQVEPEEATTCIAVFLTHCRIPCREVQQLVQTISGVGFPPDDWFIIEFKRSSTVSKPKSDQDMWQLGQHRAAAQVIGVPVVAVHADLHRHICATRKMTFTRVQTADRSPCSFFRRFPCPERCVIQKGARAAMRAGPGQFSLCFVIATSHVAARPGQGSAQMGDQSEYRQLQRHTRIEAIADFFTNVAGSTRLLDVCFT